MGTYTVLHFHTSIPLIPVIPSFFLDIYICVQCRVMWMNCAFSLLIARDPSVVFSFALQPVLVSRRIPSTHCAPWCSRPWPCSTQGGEIDPRGAGLIVLERSFLPCPDLERIGSVCCSRRIWNLKLCYLKGYEQGDALVVKGRPAIFWMSYWLARKWTSLRGESKGKILLASSALT